MTHMLRSSIILAVCVASVAPAAAAQRLADRLAAVRDGDVRFQYASRPGACGDGDRYVRMGSMFFARNGRSVVTGFGTIRDGDRRCQEGLAEARLTLRDGRLADVRSSVPPSGEVGARNLGRVSTAEVRDYFLRQLEAAPEDEHHALYFALLLADSVRVWPDLVRLGRDASRSEKARARALSWAGHDGDPAARDPLADILLDRAQPGKVRQGAAIALHNLDDPAANRVLFDFVRRGDDVKIRSALVHIIGDDDADARAVFRSIASDANAPEEIRSSVFLVLGESDDPQDGKLLRSLLPSLTSTKLASRLLHAVSERDDLESGRWLISVSEDVRQPFEVRKQALFWAGESDLPIAELVSAYDRLNDRKLREHAIFVLHERDESAATDKLMQIAQHDPDVELRKKAVFWLAERKDARSAEFIKRLLQ